MTEEICANLGCGKAFELNGEILECNKSHLCNYCKDNNIVGCSRICTDRFQFNYVCGRDYGAGIKLCPFCEKNKLPQKEDNHSQEEMDALRGCEGLSSEKNPCSDTPKGENSGEQISVAKNVECHTDSGCDKKLISSAPLNFKTLSDKIKNIGFHGSPDYLSVEDVKEAVKELKNKWLMFEYSDCPVKNETQRINEIINEIFGEKLIE